MSHDNKVTVNTTLNSVVIVDSEQNQINITHPVTRVIEVTAQPATAVTVIEETPNRVNVNESDTRIIHVVSVGPQGIQGIQGPSGSQGIQGIPGVIPNTGSFATTGSNVFIGNQIVTGSIYVTGNVGIGTGTPLSNLHVLKGLSGAPLLGLDDGITLTLENDTTNFINFRSPNAVAAGLAFTTPGDNSAGYITLRQDTGEVYYSTENSNGYHRFIIGSTERLRINNAGVIVTGSSLFLGNQTITGSFSVSGSTLQTGNNTLIGNTTLSGSIEVSGSSNFHNSLFTVTGSSNFLGNVNFDGNVNVVYSSSFYHWGNKLFNYGAFSDTTSQSGSANTAYTMKFNTNDVVGYGVNIVSQSRITVDHTGLYNVQFSTQLDRVAGSGNALVSIWLRVTGSDVANSCTDVALTGNAASAASVAAWNFVFPMSASQYCELAWSTTDANIHISAIGTRTGPIRPAVPSVIATLTQIA